MPKRSRRDTEVTINVILNVAEQQLIKLGYDKMSYTTLSVQTGISRTGISHHFPRKVDFLTALEPRLYELFIRKLVLNRSLDDFEKSWERLLSKPEFTALFKVLFNDAVNSDKHSFLAKATIEKLTQRLIEKFGESSGDTLEKLIGKSLVLMSVTS